MSEKEGRWVTIRGARVFIEEGQSVSDAFAKRKKSDLEIQAKTSRDNIKKAYDSDLRSYNSLSKDVKDKAEEMFLQHLINDTGAKQRAIDMGNFAKKYNIPIGTLSVGQVEYQKGYDEQTKEIKENRKMTSYLPDLPPKKPNGGKGRRKR